MNRAVVRGATAALARWLLGTARHGGPDAAEAGVVIGCDARHRSDEFADEAARVLAGAGIRVHLLPPQQPTPLLAFAVRHLRAAAGHHDHGEPQPARPTTATSSTWATARRSSRPPTPRSRRRSATSARWPRVPLAPPDSPLIIRHGDEVAGAYLDAVCAVSPRAAPAPRGCGSSTPRCTGWRPGWPCGRSSRPGFPAPDVVAAQAAPDPDFPTVAFPNPEEPGALDLALAQARRSGADLVLANDPDGDRLAVAVPDPSAAGGWRVLTGDQVGALLGAYLLDADPAGSLAPTTGWWSPRSCPPRCCPASPPRPARCTPRR